MTLTLVLLLVAAIVTIAWVLVDDFVRFARVGPNSEELIRTRQKVTYPTLAISAVVLIVVAVLLVVNLVLTGLGLA